MIDYQRVEEMRQRAVAWFNSMAAPESGFGVFADSPYHKRHGPQGMYLPGTYNAVNALFLLGEYSSLNEAQKDSIAAFLNSFQRQNGVYRIPEMKDEDIYYPDFEYDDLHITNYTIGALALLGRELAKPLGFMDRYNAPEKLADWLAARQMDEPWMEGNFIVNVGSLFVYLLDKGEEQYRQLLAQLMDWHTAHQDPASGYWYDPVTKDLTSAMAGTAHNLHLYHYLKRPVPRYKKIIDHCLSILDGVTSACLDVDVVDILANLYYYGYRQTEIEAYLIKKLDDLLAFQNPDGGFADVREGTRLFDGWQAYQEPQGISNGFSTWFRCITVGMISWILFPEHRSEWIFRNTLGIGYFNPFTPDELPEDTVENAVIHLPDSEQTAPVALGAEAEKLLHRVREKLASTPAEKLAAAEAVYQLDIVGKEGGSLFITIADAAASVEPASPVEPQVWLSLSGQNLNKLLDGKLNATIAYMTKKLKIRGDISLAMKLENLLR